MRFTPEEVIFSPSTRCNLNCPHCSIKKYPQTLDSRYAVKFLLECSKNGIKKIGFSGGEPFLTLNFVYSLVKNAVKTDVVFTRIMTNGVWFKDKTNLRKTLNRLYKAGYDGSIFISFDAFHGQNLKKLSLFIKTAVSIWNRNDLISLVYTRGAKNKKTSLMIKKLANMLKASLIKYSSNNICIKNAGLFIKIIAIDLAPIEKAERLKYPWDGKWFKEDYCKGPGNVFYIVPNGDVKPCCGYAGDSEKLTVGNIKYHSVREIMKKIKKNRLVFTIFNSGLTRIRQRLERQGVIFPGKTTSHCYFCHYILTKIPQNLLTSCLD